MILSLCITSLIYQLSSLVAFLWVYYDSYISTGWTTILTIGIFAVPVQIALIIITFCQTKKEINNA